MSSGVQCSGCSEVKFSGVVELQSCDVQWSSGGAELRVQCIEVQWSSGGTV